MLPHGGTCWCQRMAGKGGWFSPQQDYKYKYFQGNVDIVSDLSTLFCGFNPKRVFNAYVFLGGGLKSWLDNDEANALDTRTYEMEYLGTESFSLLGAWVWDVICV